MASSHEGQLRSTAVDECWRVPDTERDPEEFVRALARITERRQADMLIPANDTAFAAVIRNYQALADLLMLACPPPPIAD